MKPVTKKQWVAALNEIASEPQELKAFRTAQDAQDAFTTAATEAGISWDVTDEGVVFSDPTEQLFEIGESYTLTSEQADAVRDSADKAGITLPTEDKPGRPARDDATDVIEVLVAENPKREGTASHARFALYMSGMTVAAFLAAGGKRPDLAWDSARQFIRVVGA